MSKVYQIFDVSPIIPVTNETRKQPHQRQDYKKNDTVFNKINQEENKSREKSNEENGSSKEKIDYQKKIIYQPKKTKQKYLHPR